MNGGDNMIAVGNDHAGYQLKKEVIEYLEKKGIAYKDFGCGDVSTSDYPEFAKAVGRAIQNKECEKGILICGTGIGISIAANKMKGIRAALCHDCFSAEASRLHNDANILAMGARVIGPGHALKIVETFLNTEFSGEERHLRRIQMLEEK
jgi:ribose 5-phosphate isomerase B